MAHPKKTANKSSKTPRGRAPEPYTVGELRGQGDSVFHLSKRLRTLLGTAVGGALGAVVGQLAAEDPEKFTKVITAMTSAFNGGGIMGSSMPPTGGKAWFEKRLAAMWHVSMVDGLTHAYEMAFDRAPGLSACGESKLLSVEPISLFTAGKATRCDKCITILQAHGYDTKVPGSAAAPPWKSGEPVVTPPPQTVVGEPARPDMLDLGEHLANIETFDMSQEKWRIRKRSSGKLTLRVTLLWDRIAGWVVDSHSGKSSDDAKLATDFLSARVAWPPPSIHERR